jgi:hypothetical protein
MSDKLWQPLTSAIANAMGPLLSRKGEEIRPPVRFDARRPASQSS